MIDDADNYYEHASNDDDNDYHKIMIMMGMKTKSCPVIIFMIITSNIN